MNIKRWYLDLSIKYKILLFIYTLIVFVSLILGFYSYLTSEKYIVNKINSSKMEVLKQLNSSISFVMNDVNDISLYLCLDQGVQDFLSKKQNADEDVAQSGSSTYPTYNSLEFIMNLIASKGYIGSVMIYNENGLPPYNASTDRGGMLSDFSLVKDSEIYKDAKALKGSLLWEFLPAGDSTIIENNVSNKLVMCRIIKNFDNDLGEIGFIVMTINEFNIKSIYPATLNQNNESILIMDSHGRVLSNEGEASRNLTEKDIRSLSQSINSNNKGNFISTVAETKMSVNYSKIANTDWNLVYLVPMNNMVGELNSIKVITVLIVLICLIVSFPLTLIISSYLTKPIKILLKSMKRFQEGNFNERVNFRYNDEIGMLGKGYDSMVENIKELIDKAYVLQIKEREAELDALQAQINPHFLYNTLDTIFWKAERNGNKEISEMVYSLSKLFRLSLNRGKGSTLVCREKELIEHYLLLQKIRYKDNLNYVILIEPNILNLIIPKLILQPFIENAIRHGIETKEFGGTIKVSGKLMDDKIYFVVEDDGIGMRQETIQTIMGNNVEKIASESYGNGSYAVKNVNDRLKLNYGDNYTLKFTSELGKGTTVELIIPVLPDEPLKGGKAMIKLMLADDEIEIRQGIRDMIDWQANGIYVCGEAANGKEAVSQVDKLEPQIILVDISMPIMNGLEFIEYLSIHKPSIKTIIVSGYDDFTYAQKALKLGASDYLLKPCRPEEILNTVLKLADGIKNENRKLENLSKLKIQLRESLPLLKEKFLLRLLKEQNKYLESVEEKAEFFKLNIELTCVKVLLISIDNYCSLVEELGNEDVELYKFAVKNITEEILGAHYRCEVFGVDDDIAIVLNFDEKQDKSLLKDLLKLIKNNINSYMSFTVSIGVGNYYTNFSGMHSSYKEALQCLESRFFIGEDSIIYYENIGTSESEELLFPIEEEQQIIIALKTGEREELNSAYDIFFNDISKNNNSKHALNSCMALLFSIYHLCIERNINVNEIMNQNSLFEEIAKLDTVNQLKSRLFETINTVYDKLNKSKNFNKIVSMAIDFINQNYQKDISLEIIAKELHFSAGYIGLLFKQAMGMSFVDYLHRVRIGKACEILKDYRLKTYEVSNQVGYFDEKYFTQIFKKITGLTFTQYRDSL